MARGYQVAIVGATGAVGLELLSILDERKFPIAHLALLASKRSVGRTLSFAGQALPVRSVLGQLVGQPGLCTGRRPRRSSGHR